MHGGPCFHNALLLDGVEHQADVAVVQGLARHGARHKPKARRAAYLPHAPPPKNHSPSRPEDGSRDARVFGSIRVARLLTKPRNWEVEEGGGGLEQMVLSEEVSNTMIGSTLASTMPRQGRELSTTALITTFACEEAELPILAS